MVDPGRRNADSDDVGGVGQEGIEQHEHFSVALRGKLPRHRGGRALMGATMTGRRVLIVGGSRGIGRATAKRIVAEGGKVAVIGRDAAAVNASAAEIGGEGIVADMREEAQAMRAVEDAAARLGGLDGLVNCIGNSDFLKLDEIGLDDWNNAFLVNLTTHYLSCRAALPHLRASERAAIVNVSAIAGITPGMAGAAYAAAKAGVIQFTKNLAAQLAPGIRANVVSPGAVATERMLDNYMGSRTEAQAKAFLDRYAQKRLADPDEIAAPIVFLLSDAASYITGSNYVADGGRVYR